VRLETKVSQSNSGNVVLDVYRSTLPTEKAPRYDRFTVPFKKGLSLLDALIYVYENADPSLAFRWSCQNVQCGACGVLLNGRPVLACEAKLESGQTVQVDPLPLPVVKDLATDLSYVEDPAVRTFSQPLPAGRPERLLPHEVTQLAPLHQCLDCHLCDVVCPPNQGQQIIDPDCLLPSGLVQLASIVLDKHEGEPRIELARSKRVYDCLTCGACTKVCPAGIEIERDAILPLRHRSVRDGDGKHGGLFDPKDWVERWIEPKGRPFLQTAQEWYRVPGAKAEVSLFVGCLVGRRHQDLAEMTITALNRAGYDVMVPREQGCCGQPLMQLGMAEEADALLRKTLSILEKTGIQQVVTCCPECSHALRVGHWVSPNGDETVAGIEVFDLISLMPAVTAGSCAPLTVHDPCYLTKQDVALSDELAARGVTVEKTVSDCCGAGGGVRLTNAGLSRQLGATATAGLSGKQLVTGCPFCLEHFSASEEAFGPVSHYVEMFVEQPVGAHDAPAPENR
jgi:fumarate reductase (CoM/CoB) subunit B